MSNDTKIQVFREHVVSILKALPGERGSLNAAIETLVHISLHLLPTDLLRAGTTSLIFAPAVRPVARMYGPLAPAEAMQQKIAPNMEREGMALYLLSPEDAENLRYRSKAMPTLEVDIAEAFEAWEAYQEMQKVENQD